MNGHTTNVLLTKTGASPLASVGNTFEVFHKDRRTRLVHYVTIPAIAFFCMAFCAQWQVEGVPLLNAGLGYALLLALVHAPWCLRKRAMPLYLLILAALGGMWIGATAYLEATRVSSATWYAPTLLGANPLLWIYLFSFAETVSHGFEPMPPYASGTDRFVTRLEFWRTGRWYRVACIVSVPTLYTLVSLCSNVHLLPTLLLRILAASGIWNDYLAAVRDQANEQWRSGQPLIDRVPDPLVGAWSARSRNDAPRHGRSQDYAARLQP